MSEQVQASHILISHSNAPNSDNGLSNEDALEKITEIKEKLDSGESFSELATHHSDCPSSQKGGDLGLFGKGAMVPTFDEAVFKLEVGEISDVVETEFGYHLIHRTA